MGKLARKTACPAQDERFTGVDWSQSLLRPGCQDFLKCPSLRDGKLHAHRPPILNAASVKGVV